MLEIKKRIPRRFTIACIHYFVSVSIIISGFLSPIVANGQITLLSPGVIVPADVTDPDVQDQAVTDVFTVFKWSSTSPQDSTSSYKIELSSINDFTNPEVGIVVNTVPPFPSNQILSSNESQTIVNVASDLYAFEPADEILTPGEEIYWRVVRRVNGAPVEQSPVFFTFYKWQQIQGFNTILGQVFISDLNHSRLSAANITIAAADISTPLGNQPDNMISLTTDDNGNFLGYAVSSVEPVLADNLPFPIRIIVRKAGFADISRDIASEVELNATCDIANPTNTGTCFLLTPLPVVESPPPVVEPPPPVVHPPPGKVNFVPIYRLLLGKKTP